MPHTNKLIKELADDPIQFISITDEDADKIERFLGKRKMLGWVGVDTKRKSHSAYGVKGIPDTFVIDKTGKLVLRTRPESLNAKLLRSVADGTYVAPAPRERERPGGKEEDKTGLPRVSLGQGGVDPLWVPWIEAGQLSQRDGGYFHQTVMRPSPEIPNSWWGGSSTSNYGGGLGITLLAKTTKELLSESMGISLSHFDGADDDFKWDVIYSRPKQESMEDAWAEVTELVEQAAGIETKRIQREMTVQVVSVDLTKLQRNEDIDWDGDLTTKSLQPAAELISSFENKSGEYAVHGTEGLDRHYVDTFGVEMWSLSVSELKAWLEEKGFSFAADKRTVEIVTIDGLAAQGTSETPERPSQDTASDGAFDIIGEWDLEVAPDDMPPMNVALTLERSGDSLEGELSQLGGKLTGISWDEESGRLKFTTEPEEGLSISFDLARDKGRLVGSVSATDGVTGEVTATRPSSGTKAAPSSESKAAPPQDKASEVPKKEVEKSQLEPAGLDLKVLFVGELDTERTLAYTEFLSQHVKEVTLAPLDGSAPLLAKEADVVVVDWPTRQGFEPTMPLGERALWDKPTVFLGSAYLRLSTEWRVTGGWG